MKKELIGDYIKVTAWNDYQGTGEIDDPCPVPYHRRLMIWIEFIKPFPENFRVAANDLVRFSLGTQAVGIPPDIDGIMSGGGQFNIIRWNEWPLKQPQSFELIIKDAFNDLFLQVYFARVIDKWDNISVDAIRTLFVDFVVGQGGITPKQRESALKDPRYREEASLYTLDKIRRTYDDVQPLFEERYPIANQSRIKIIQGGNNHFLREMDAEVLGVFIESMEGITFRWSIENDPTGKAVLFDTSSNSTKFGISQGSSTNDNPNSIFDGQTIIVRCDISDGTTTEITRWNITIRGYNRPPVLNIGGNLGLPTERLATGHSITPNVEGSYDPDGDGIDTQWFYGEQIGGRLLTIPVASGMDTGYPTIRVPQMTSSIDLILRLESTAGMHKVIKEVTAYLAPSPIPEPESKPEQKETKMFRLICTNGELQITSSQIASAASDTRFQAINSSLVGGLIDHYEYAGTTEQFLAKYPASVQSQPQPQPQPILIPIIPTIKRWRWRSELVNTGENFETGIAINTGKKPANVKLQFWGVDTLPKELGLNIPAHTSIRRNVEGDFKVLEFDGVIEVESDQWVTLVAFYYNPSSTINYNYTFDFEPYPDNPMET